MPYPLARNYYRNNSTGGRGTEQVKTAQVNLDHFNGHFCGHFRGRLRGMCRGSFRGESLKG